MSLCLYFTRLYILFTKNKMVVIGNKKNKKTRKRLPQKKRRQWNVREKLMIVHYFENNGSVRSTAKRFSIQPKQLYDWKKKKETLLATAPHVTKLHPDKPAKYPILEGNLFAWISEKKELMEMLLLEN
jgi:transposase-like protein